MFLFKSEWDKNWISIGWRQIKYNHIILYIMLGDIKKICDFCDHKTSRSSTMYDKMSFNSFRGNISFTISSFMRTRTLFVQKNVINFSPWIWGDPSTDNRLKFHLRLSVISRGGCCYHHHSALWLNYSLKH